MLRNILLLVSSLAILLVLFIGYVLLVNDPAADKEAGPALTDGLPLAREPGSRALRVADLVEVPPGEGIAFTLYDDQTGRPVQHFACERWTPLPESEDEVAVTGPELTLWPRPGLRVTIAADEGQLVVESLERTQGRPRAGWLRGHVRIVADRAVARGGAGPSTQPSRRVTVDLDRLDFNLETGQLHAEGPLRVVGDDFELAGSGLSLVWNEADNTLESLRLEHGERLVLYGSAGLMRPASRAEEAPRRDAPAEPVRPPSSASPSGPSRGPEAYAVVLRDGVEAEQFGADGQSAGRLTADEVRLVFDLGGRVGQMLGSRPPTKAADTSPTVPTTTSAPAPRGRLVVQWEGPLVVLPDRDASGSGERRHFEALGSPVRLVQGERQVVCARLVYFDERQQLWLYPPEGGRIEFAGGDRLSGSAESVYYDGRRRVVKLVGAVDLLAGAETSSSGTARRLRCGLWAELHLAAPGGRPGAASAAGSDFLDYGRLESATFVGDARVELGEQNLSAQRLEVAFRPADTDGDSFEGALESATARGEVRFEQRDESLEAARLDLRFDLTPAGALYPTHLDARGDVIIARDRSWLRGRQVVAEMQPAPPDSPPDGPEFVLRTLDITGDAELRDPPNRVAARGASIHAEFVGLNRLDRGYVSGTAERYGLVHASPYTVAGERIDLDWESQSLLVNGPARLRFRTTRGFQGQRRSEPALVVVHCTEGLHVEGRQNTVRFEGGVVAQRGEEELRADRLTLLLEDVVPAEAPEPKPAPALAELLRQARRAIAQSRRSNEGDWLATRDAGEPRMHKEPVRLIAENALVQSESYESGDLDPVVHFSIAAPRLEVDIPRREIVTRGETTLLLTNRRLPAAEESPSPTLGLPSGLITRGPSQTAMRCAEGLVYVLGEEGPEREDSVVFRGDVFFRHCAGRDMVHLKEMLPELENQPEWLERLKSRDTQLVCDRLECGLRVGGGSDLAEPTPGARGTEVQLAWLLASGNTELRDRQEATVRTIWAQRIEFDRAAAVVRVLGSETADARVYEENTQDGTSRILVGEAFLIDLHTNTVRSGPTRGEFHDR